MKTPSFSLAELCALVDLPLRTVRYYAQLGLIGKPVGETRAARYGALHLEQLLQVKKWADAGLSLERIKEIVQGEEPKVPAKPRSPGDVEVVSHLFVADGLQVLIEPSRARMTPEQVRAFATGVIDLYKTITDTGHERASRTQKSPNSDPGTQ